MYTWHVKGIGENADEYACGKGLHRTHSQTAFGVRFLHDFRDGRGYEHLTHKMRFSGLWPSEHVEYQLPCWVERRNLESTDDGDVF